MGTSIILKIGQGFGLLVIPQSLTGTFSTARNLVRVGYKNLIPTIFA